MIKSKDSEICSSCVSCQTVCLAQEDADKAKRISTRTTQSVPTRIALMSQWHL